MENIKISILILTHNRPELFKRCINSVINSNPKNYEILVNNDSHDITEIQGENIRYYYQKHYDLSSTYKFLFDNAKGDYIYFLEDDDYIIKDFWRYIDYSYNINYLNYLKYEAVKNIKTKFKIETVNEDFQLSQILFQKALVKKFPIGNNIYNDWELFQSIKNTSINIVPKIMFIQTQDGKDNISSIYNKDVRFGTV